MQWIIEVRLVGRCGKCGTELRGHPQSEATRFAPAFPKLDALQQDGAALNAAALRSASSVALSLLSAELRDYEQHTLEAGVISPMGKVYRRELGCHVCGKLVASEDAQ